MINSTIEKTLSNFKCMMLGTIKKYHQISNIAYLVPLKEKNYRIRAFEVNPLIKSHIHSYLSSRLQKKNCYQHGKRITLGLELASCPEGFPYVLQGILTLHS